ncbi:phosphatase PAP2 family protein [uncultured Thiodictyon sp.]|uniref:phosphatase PAP2 family protein n=1 Tax=uncultured Thiodictyon sp. TaxID=1846217 RepID=UPI0025D1E3F1|nr:phosphatase PAP2 family protein [uncultured Thiodictyon sp.]
MNLLARLYANLGQALAAGALRTPLDPPNGGVWLAAWAAVCLTIGLTLWLVGGYHAAFIALNTAAGPHPQWVWAWLTALGGDLAPFALGLFFARRYPRVFWALVLGGVVAVAYSRGLKPLFDTLRPPAVLPPDSFNLIGPALRKLSFPSGHSVTAGLFCGVFVYYARHWEARTLWVLLALLVGLSRVAVGVHWPVDVAFGLGGGVLSAWIGARLAARFSAGATHPATHLTLVTLCAGCAIVLIVQAAEDPLAQPLLVTLGCSALAYALASYVIWPLSCCLKPAGARL